MKNLSVGLLFLAIGGLSMSPGQSGAPPAQQMSAAGANREPVAEDAAVASLRPSRRVTRRLVERDRDPVLGLVLLVTLEQAVHAR